MSNAFLGRLVISESMVIKTNDLAVALKKVSPDDVKGLNMEEGTSKFKLPNNLGNVGGGSVNAKVSCLNRKVPLFQVSFLIINGSTVPRFSIEIASSFVLLNRHTLCLSLIRSETISVSSRFFNFTKRSFSHF